MWPSDSTAGRSVPELLYTVQLTHNDSDHKDVVTLKVSGWRQNQKDELAK